MKSLLMVTSWYPISNGDAAFISSEISHVAKKFDQVHVLCSNTPSGKHTVLQTPENVTVYFNKRKYRQLRRIINMPKVFLSIFFINEIKYLISVNQLSMSKLIKTLIFAVITFDFIKPIKYIIEKTNTQLIYTYWYSNSTLAAVLLKDKFKLKCVTRTHGGDLYDYREYQPFKRYMDKYLNKIFFISKNGYDYYLKTFAGSEKSKYIVSRLGIVNNMNICEYKNHGKFNIVSCSYMVSIKRINLIIETLSTINEIDINWTHIGNGPDWEYNVNRAETLLGNKSNITYNFCGYMNNLSILELYQNSYFDCFMSVSETEGLPVSMMEAISFGIPLIGTNVGGVSEIINEQTGILLTANPDVEEIKRAVFNLHSGENREAIRKSARLFWEEHFNSEKNYIEFASMLANI